MDKFTVADMVEAMRNKGLSDAWIVGYLSVAYEGAIQELPEQERGFHRAIIRSYVEDVRVDAIADESAA